MDYEWLVILWGYAGDSDRMVIFDDFYRAKNYAAGRQRTYGCGADVISMTAVEDVSREFGNISFI